jgi:hypothetical protein
MNTVKINKEILQKLLDNFHEVCGLANEMDIYEFREGDRRMQRMKKWADANFGYEIKKEEYLEEVVPNYGSYDEDYDGDEDLYDEEYDSKED